MKPPTIRTAEHIARACGADGAILIAFDADGIASASWGSTVPRCRQLGRMLDRIVDALESGAIHGEDETVQPGSAQVHGPAAQAWAGSAQVHGPAAQAWAGSAQVEAAEEWEEFVGEATDLLGALDDLPDRAEDFAAGVRERLEGMIEWAEENEHVTPAMQAAFANMSAGVARWER